MSKWFWYNRGTIPPYRAELIFQGLLYVLKNRIPVAFVSTWYFNHEQKLSWAWEETEIRKVGKYVINTCKNPQAFKKHCADLNSRFNKAFSAAEKIRNTDLSILSNYELKKLYRYFINEISSAHGVSNTYIDGIDHIFEDFLQKTLRNSLHSHIDEQEFDSLFKRLSIPAYVSYLNLQTRDIAIMAGKKISDEIVEQIYNKYWWTNLGWENVHPHTVQYFKKEILKYRKRKGLKKMIYGIVIGRRKIIAQRRKLIKQYRLPKIMNHWLNFLDQYTHFHDLRKEMQVKTLYSSYLLLKEVGKRLNLKVADLEWLRYHEIFDLLNGAKIDRDEINKRKKAISIKILRSGIFVLSGKKAEKTFKAELQKLKLNKDICEIKGMSATRGRITGRVKVCSGAEESLRKIKKGDILVAPMTLPDYFPAMRKAKAIITDEGGLTCHAVIVSRELKIPCIVNTKIATKVLKDGDLVEVDGDKGIVKIIKKI